MSTDSGLFYHADRRRSITALTSDAGTLVTEIDYDEFGSPVVESAPHIYQPYGFAGRERDRESGLYWDRLRYGVPKHGRFSTANPIGIAGGLNFYVDLENDPINNTVGFDRTSLR